MASVPVLSVVAPVYNEEKGIRAFHERLKAALEKASVESYEVIYVDDGSKDGSLGILRDIRRADPRVRILTFSRNFGHQLAILAGVDHAQGDAVVTIDSDLQDPPEAIAELLAKWREGYDVVYAKRMSRAGETFFKKATAGFYYRFLRKISSVDVPEDTGDFRLVSRRVADVVRSVRDRHPYLRGLVAWAGFRQTSIGIQREPRFAGVTKYPLSKMLGLAWNGISHFSVALLWLPGIIGGAGIAACGVLLAVHTVSSLYGVPPSETAWWSLSLLFMASVQLMGLALIGGYLGRAYQQIGTRPLYILQDDPERPGC